MYKVCFSEISLAQAQTVGQSMSSIGGVLRIVHLPLPPLLKSLSTARRKTSMATGVSRVMDPAHVAVLW